MIALGAGLSSVTSPACFRVGGRRTPTLDGPAPRVTDDGERRRT